MFDRPTRLHSAIPLIAAALGACGQPAPYRESSAAVHRAKIPSHLEQRSLDSLLSASALQLYALVAAVLARNPGIEAARQAWRQVLARYPSVTSFEDTQVTVAIAPLSLFASEVRTGFSAQLSQALPYFGKRSLRGDVILAEADARRQDHESVRQRVALMAARLYYEYFLIERALEVNAEHVRAVKDLLKVVELKITVGRAFSEDALKLDVDVAELRSQRAALESRRDVAIAGINALLHRGPRQRLPPPPKTLSEPSPLPSDGARLVARALQQRPELHALEHRRRGARAEVALAGRDYYPDLRLIGTYNRMWPMVEHQVMVGLSVNLPLQRSRRRADQQTAEIKVRRTEVERSRAADEIALEVTTALRRAREADTTSKLYRDQVLPAARQRVTATLRGLDTGRTGFIEVLRATHEVHTVELRRWAALTAAHRYRAELSWAVGERPGTSGGAR